MGIGESVKAAGRILLDSPEILRVLKDISDDQRQLNIAFASAVAELRSEVRHLGESKIELRTLLNLIQGEVIELRVALAAAASATDLTGLEQRVAHLEGLIHGASLTMTNRTATPRQRAAIPLPKATSSPTD
jgi:hypothetical protein